MANKNALNKNSVYVQSLVDFVLDTKPYHSKLTEIVEEYRFFDEVNVKFKERFTSKTKINSSWMYNYFSSANPLYRTMPAQRLVSPSFMSETYVVGRDENKDLALVPYAYSKKGLDGIGASQVFIRHAAFSEALTESVDYFQSKGSFQFQIKQTRNANGVINPLWASTADDNVITDARTNTVLTALDRTNPSSAWNRIRALLDEITVAVDAIGDHAEVRIELNKLYAILDSNTLPQSYEALLAWLAIPNYNNVMVELEEPHDRQWFEQQFSNNTSPLFFGMFTDLGVRESGRQGYLPVASPHMRVTNIKSTEGLDVEEWILETVQPGSDSYRLTGTTTGFAGFVKAGEAFNNGRVSFNTQKISTPIVGDRVELTPTQKIVISPDAPLETWNIIKTNPLAHDRPQLTSARFGHIKDLNGKVGNVSILDATMPTGDIVLTYRANGIFDLYRTADSYSGVVTVGQLFNDNRLAFTVVQGQRAFVRGDRFYISIENLPAHVEDLDLGYGYDLDPYDDDISLYPDGNKIGFYYDGRFTDYDLTALNLQVTQSAVNGRKWRFRALPDYTRPIASFPSGDPSLNDLSSFYADRFAVEFSDDEFTTRTQVGTVPIGGHFETEYGISFDLPAASRPFIAVSADNGQATGRIEGGDVFSFMVRNPDPKLIESPIGLSSLNAPRLNLHSEGFFNVRAAQWVVQFVDANTYTVSNGTNTLTAKIPTNGINTREGLSFKGMGVHFTIVPTGGMEAGDQFTFNTFEDKPTYLVHGSVTGWTAPATVGKYYWNGKIGFKIARPRGQTFVNDTAQSAGVSFDIREDAPSLIYTFLENDFGWSVTRSDTGEAVFAEDHFIDKYVNVDLTGANTSVFKLVVDAHDLPLWNSSDVIILNPTVKSRLPEMGAAVVIEKTEDAKLSLNIVPSRLDISDLGPVTIDQRFIDVNTRGIPLSFTSPETSLLQGWIPMNMEKWDSDTSIAEFSDPATRFTFKSAVSGEPIGVLKDTVFEWDTAFYTKYLPLNAEANFVVAGTGWNDKAHTKITESIKFLVGGGALTEDWMFHDDIHVEMVDNHKWNIVTNYNDNLQTSVNDGPFGGFLAGYANVPYDGVSAYDDVVTSLPETYPVGEQFYDESNSTLYTMTVDGWDAGEFIVQTATAPSTGEAYFNPTTKQLFRKT